MSVAQQVALDSNSLWVGVGPTASLPGGVGTSDPFGLAGQGPAIVASVVTGVTGSPSLQVFLDVQDAGGNWQQVAALTAQTGAGVQSAVAQAATIAAVAAGAARTARFRWTLTGSGTASVLMTAAGR
jgi:hypothetical protein